MPLKEFRCDKCDKVTEHLIQHGEKDPVECEECKSPLVKLVSLSSFKLNCLGFYSTDNNKKSSR